MRKIALAALLALVLAGASYGASEEELKKMSTFISNFTETGMAHIDIDDISDAELAYFGVWHNYANNYRTRIEDCPKSNCPYGSLRVHKDYVAESVRKYFDLDISHRNANPSKPKPGSPHYDGRQYYHFSGADGESIQAVVTEAVKRGNVVSMKGYIYYADHEDEDGGEFTATAKPYKFGGKNTWSILTLDVKYY